MKKRLNAKIDKFIDDTNALFVEFLAAKTMYDIGRGNVDSIADNVAISPLVGVDLRLEPIPISFIKQYKNNYPHFILEVYHVRLVQLWNNLLDDIFCILIEEHINGGRRFSELKKQQVKVDFDSTEDLLVQLKEKLIEDFAFVDYPERQRIINKALNPNDKGQNELDNLKKNILIRNLIQHRGSIVDDYILGKLGSSQVQLYDDDGDLKTYRPGDKILLSIPEIHNFIRSLLLVVQKWRIE
jgi:hypothetical protein